MKKIILPIALTSLFIALLLGLKVVNAVEKGYHVEIVYDYPSVKFSRVNIKSVNKQLVLSGRVKRRSPNASVFPGHIDVVVKKDNQQVILHKVITYTPNRLNKHRIFGSKFNLVLPENLPKGTAIKIKWHRNQSTNHMVSSVFSIQNTMI